MTFAPAHFLRPRLNGIRSNWYGALGFLGAMSCLVRQPLAGKPLQGEFGALLVIDAERDTGVLPEVEFGQIAVEMFDINVLVDANQTTLKDAKEAFQRVGMHVVTHLFELGMINGFMAGDRRKLVARRSVAHEAAVLVDVATDHGHGAAVVKHGRADIAATLDKAEHDGVMRLAAEVRRALGLARPRQFRLVCLHNLASATQRAKAARRRHGEADTVAKVPSRFHAAAQRALKLAGRNTFLGRAKQVDGLKPQAQRKVAVLKDGANADRERLAAGVALAQARAGRLAGQPADALGVRVLAMRADRAVGPKLGFDVLKGGFLVVEAVSGKNRFGHGLSPMAKILDMGHGYVK